MNVYFENLNGKKRNVFENIDKFKLYNNNNLHSIQFYDEEGKCYLFKDLPTVVQQSLSGSDDKPSYPKSVNLCLSCIRENCGQRTMLTGERLGVTICANKID